MDDAASDIVALSAPFVIAGLGACTAECVTTPLDCIKTRLQLMGELGARARYTTPIGAAITIMREEGVRALYRGLQPALLRQASYGSLRMGGYEPLKDFLAGSSPPTLVHKLLSGVLCGAGAAAVCCPADVVKVRMQAPPRGVRAPYRHVLHALASIYAHEGFRGLWAGVSPTVQRAAIVTSIELATYDEAKSVLVTTCGASPHSSLTHICASLLAGALSCLVASPADVIKSRIMDQAVDSRGRGLVYTSTLDCARKSIAAEGVLSLWKGLIPAFARQGPHCVVTYSVVEQLRALYAAHKAGAAAAAPSLSAGMRVDSEARDES